MIQRSIFLSNQVQIKGLVTEEQATQEMTHFRSLLNGASTAKMYDITDNDSTMLIQLDHVVFIDYRPAPVETVNAIPESPTDGIAEKPEVV
jgi:hypothetical protein